MQQPTIFDRSQVLISTSSKNDGHMSFGHIKETDTTRNIMNFIKNLDWPVKKIAYIRLKYSPNETYDIVKVANNRNTYISVSIENSFRTDALITKDTNLLLLLATADCYAFTLFDPVNKILSLAHLGWHSTNANLLEKTIKIMAKKYGTRAENLLIHVGPGIPKERYLHDDPIQNKLSSWKPYCHKTPYGYQVDILGYNLNQQSKQGVKPKNIGIDPRNTVDDENIESHYIHTKSNKYTARRFLNATMMR